MKAAITDPVSTNTFRSRSLQSDINIDTNNHFAIGELTFDDSLLHLNFGLWNYRALSAIQTDINQSGFFLDAEWKTSLLTPFLKIGFADKVTNLVSSSLALGINLNDLLLNNETLGLGYVSANIEGKSEPETIIELIYKKTLWDTFFSALSLQKVNNTFFTNEDAYLYTFRLGFDFEIISKENSSSP